MLHLVGRSQSEAVYSINMTTYRVRIFFDLHNVIVLRDGAGIWMKDGGIRRRCGVHSLCMVVTVGVVLTMHLRGVLTFGL